MPSRGTVFAECYRACRSESPVLAAAQVLARRTWALFLHVQGDKTGWITLAIDSQLGQ